MDSSKIRNFSIIAHIDHGKSTLADRILELALNKKVKHERITDTLELEQEKGITIKLQAVSLNWKGYTLNLIDTPGHVDFSYEVSRSLKACDSAILLVDATQGIQAQTISTAQQAKNLNLKLIPVINKIDMPNANIPKTQTELIEFLRFKEDEILKVSAKTGEGVEHLLDMIINKTPAPRLSKNSNLRALVFDSKYSEHKGVIVTVRVFDGVVKKDKLYALAKKNSFTPLEIGIFTPEMKPKDSLKAGEVGYIATGDKNIKNFTIGDTISDNIKTQPLSGYQKPSPNVFASLFATDTKEFLNLKKALNKLALNDSALTFTEQKSALLGSGFRCGFLGLLHMEIVQERLEREFGINLIITAPTVRYQIVTQKGIKQEIQTPNEMPPIETIEEIKEPWAKLEIFTPEQYMGNIMQLCQIKRAIYKDTEYISIKGKTPITYIKLIYEIPLASLMSNFFSQLKNISQGFASMNYKFLEYRSVDLVKVDILVNKKVIPSLSFLETRENARPKAVKLLEIMKKVIPRQQFQVPLQAAIGSTIIARENIKAYRKDVTAKLYGGDYSRKLKLLNKQKKGKKRLKQIGKVNIPQEAFLAILQT